MWMLVQICLRNDLRGYAAAEEFTRPSPPEFAAQPHGRFHAHRSRPSLRALGLRDVVQTRPTSHVTIATRGLWQYPNLRLWSLIDAYVEAQLSSDTGP